MKLSRGITVNGKLCPADLYEAIVRLKPDAQRGELFSLTALPGDEEGARLVDVIAAMCKERGLENIRGAYVHGVATQYEPSDFEAAPLLWLMGQKRTFKGINSNQRDERGRIVLPATEAKLTVKIASIFPTPWIVVSSAVRRVLESGGLVGVRFDEVSIQGHSVHAASEPFWELRSIVTLPKMLNTEIDPNPAFDPPRHRFLADGTYGEPHYLESSLRGVGAFDIAHTFERLHAGEPFGAGQAVLIVSQRFYQHCRKNKIPLEVRPVRIDPG